MSLLLPERKWRDREEDLYGQMVAQGWQAAAFLHQFIEEWEE